MSYISVATPSSAKSNVAGSSRRPLESGRAVERKREKGRVSGHTGDGGDVREGGRCKQSQREVGQVGQEHEDHRPRRKQQRPFPVFGRPDLRQIEPGERTVGRKYRLGYQLTPLHTIHSSGRKLQRMKRTKRR